MKQSNARANTNYRANRLNLGEKQEIYRPTKSGKAAINFRREK